MAKTKKTVVILISGKAEGGKTTVAEILQKKLQDYPALTVFRYGFADPIKYIAKAFAGWDEKKDERGRKLLQQIGKVFREYDEYIWVKHFLGQLDRKSGIFPFNFAIIDDWRFPNENAYLLNNPLLEVITIRVFGRGGLNGSNASDASENSLPEVTADAFTWSYDYVINNSEDVTELEKKLDIILASLEKQYIVE